MTKDKVLSPILSCGTVFLTVSLKGYLTEKQARKFLKDFAEAVKMDSNRFELVADFVLRDLLNPWGRLDEEKFQVCYSTFTIFKLKMITKDILAGTLQRNCKRWKCSINKLVAPKT